MDQAAAQDEQCDFLGDAGLGRDQCGDAARPGQQHVGGNRLPWRSVFGHAVDTEGAEFFAEAVQGGCARRPVSGHPALRLLRLSARRRPRLLRPVHLVGLRAARLLRRYPVVCGVWLIHVIMAGNDKYIYFNKYFLVLFLVMFSLGMGACWEIVEYTYDSLSGTNTQQFMASTTGSIFTAEDIPLCGHDALRDTMTDLILDLVGAFAVAVYGFVQHNRLKERYAFAVRLMEIDREEMGEVKD